jgi:ribonuclease P protein component
MTPRQGQGFPKAARIRHRREFLSLGRSGEKRRTKSFVFVLGQVSDVPRLGITVSRKVGGAVTRNLVKRRIREAFRRHPTRTRFGRDLVVIAKEGIGAVPFASVRRDLGTVLGSAIGG